MAVFVPAATKLLFTKQPTYLTDQLSSLSLSPLSPLSPYSPFAPAVVINKAIPPIVTATNTLYPVALATNTYYSAPIINDVDAEMDDNYFVQKQMTEYLQLRVLDKWLYDDSMCYLLKYLKVDGEKVSVVQATKENKVCDDNIEVVEKKIDYIEQHILTFSKMKALISKIIYKTGFKWYKLATPQYEKIVVRTVEKYLRKKLQNLSSE